MRRTVPVQKWAVTLEDAIVDEAAALRAWHELVRAHGWSPVGDPRIVGSSIVVGRLVKHPGLTVSPDIHDAIVVPYMSGGRRRSPRPRSAPPG